MITLQIECFEKNSTECNLKDSNESIKINNPLQRTFKLQVGNSGPNVCQVFLVVESKKDHPEWQGLSFTLLKDDSLLYRGLVFDYLDKSHIIGTLKSEQNLSLIFDFDLLELLVAEKSIDANFDLYLDFKCQPTKLIEKSLTEETKVVLSSSNDGVLIENEVKNESIWKVYFWSSLFVLVFFVIIKIVNGKKKKKNS